MLGLIANYKSIQKELLTKSHEIHGSLRLANTRPPMAGDDFRKYSIK